MLYRQCLICDTAKARTLFAYLTIILNALYNGTNFNIILKIVVDAPVAFFPLSPPLCLKIVEVCCYCNCCWLLTAAVLFGIKCIVEKFGLWCELSAHTLSIWTTFLMLILILILNFPSGMLITSMALLNFSWTAFFSLFDFVSFETLQCLMLSPTFQLFFPLSWMLNDIFAKFTQFDYVKVYTSINIHTHAIESRFSIPMAVVNSSNWVLILRQPSNYIMLSFQLKMSIKNAKQPNKVQIVQKKLCIITNCLKPTRWDIKIDNTHKTNVGASFEMLHITVPSKML